MNLPPPSPKAGAARGAMALVTALMLGLALLACPRARAAAPSPAANYQKTLKTLRGRWSTLRRQRARLAALRKRHAARQKNARASSRARAGSKAGFLLTADEAQGLEAPPTGLLWVFQLQPAALDQLKASPPPPAPTPTPTFQRPTVLLLPPPKHPKTGPSAGAWFPPLIAPAASAAAGSGFLSRAGNALAGAWTRFGAPAAAAVGAPTAIPSPGSAASALGAPTGALTPGNFAATLSAVPTGVPDPGSVAAALHVPTGVSTPAPAALLSAAASLFKAPAKTKAPTPSPVSAPPPAQAAASGPKQAPTQAPAGAGPAAASATAAVEAPPAGLDADQVAQLKDLLTPLLGREYPTQELFEAALDARLCSYARTLILNALRSEPTPPSPAQRASILAQVQPPPWERLKNKRLAAKYAALPADGMVAPGRLTWYLLPYGVRQWLLDQAEGQRPLSYDAPIEWDNPDAGINLGGLYPADGFYPLWMAQDLSQTPDFRVLSRVSLFAFTFGTRGDLDTPKDWTGLTGFLAQAAAHRTRVDFTLYRDDWDFLRTLAPRDRRTLVQAVSQNALDLLDTPLPGAFARVKERLPFFGEPQDFGDGITLWLVPPGPSDADLSRRFTVFYRALAEGLISALRSGPRDYALNLVICDPRYFHAPCFSVPTLYALFQDAESPPTTIQPGTYASRTNLTLRFIVPLSDPVSVSAERLRGQVVGEADLFGSVENLPLFMAKTVPLLFWDSGAFGQQPESVDLDPARDLKDNLVRLDSFYGTAFWPAPLLKGGAQSRELDQFLWADLAQPGVRPPSRLVSLVVRYRWPLRCLFEALLLALLAALAFLARRRLGDLPRMVQAGLGLLVIAVLTLGALLLESDPRLAVVHRHHPLLWLLIVVPALGVVFAVFKPRAEEL